MKLCTRPQFLKELALDALLLRDIEILSRGRKRYHRGKSRRSTITRVDTYYLWGQSSRIQNRIICLHKYIICAGGKKTKIGRLARSVSQGWLVSLSVRWHGDSGLLGDLEPPRHDRDRSDSLVLPSILCWLFHEEEGHYQLQIAYSVTIEGHQRLVLLTIDQRACGFTHSLLNTHSVFGCRTVE